MSGAAVEGGNTLGLVHAEGGAKERLIVEVLRVGIATLAIQELTHIVTAV